ncbi:MAG: type II secretion system protein [Duganella sp.]
MMFLVAVLSIISVRALDNTLTRERRDKEAQLLDVGQAYLQAIQRYYEGAPGSVQSYPLKLEDLLLDVRLTRPTRPLRKLYRDPITGSSEWGLVLEENGGIKGVYSLSNARPFKQDGFREQLQSFTGAARYSDWKFVYQPQIKVTP